MICSLARLESRDLDTIKSLEGELGRPLLAFSCHDVAPAELSDEQVARIKSLEDTLGVFLVAVKG